MKDDAGKNALRFAARENAFPRAQGTKQAFRYPYVIARDTSELRLSHSGFYIDENGKEVNCEDYTMRAVSCEANGIVVTATYDGKPSREIKGGDVDKQSDVILPSQFGLEEFKQGDVIWVKGIVTDGSDEVAKPFLLGRPIMDSSAFAILSGQKAGHA